MTGKITVEYNNKRILYLVDVDNQTEFLSLTPLVDPSKIIKKIEIDIPEWQVENANAYVAELLK